MKHTYAWLIVILLGLPACKSDVENKPDANVAVVKVEEREGFKDIEILFKNDKFESKDEISLLKEIRICSDDPQLLNKSEVPPCSPDNFKFLPLRADMELKNGFILLIKAETGGFPLRRILIFQREKGELVKVNGFVANIIGRVKNASGWDDLVLRFQDKDGESKMWYNCTFSWNDGQYGFTQVERIEGPNWGGPVLEKYKKETSKDVYEAILNNKMIF